MKERYLLLAGYSYYSSPGMCGCRGVFSTIEEALLHYANQTELDSCDDYDENMPVSVWEWRQIIDLETGKMVMYVSDGSMYGDRGVREEIVSDDYFESDEVPMTGPYQVYCKWVENCEFLWQRHGLKSIDGLINDSEKPSHFLSEKLRRRSEEVACNILKQKQRPLEFSEVLHDNFWDLF